MILLTCPDKAVTRSEKDTNAMTRVQHTFQPHGRLRLSSIPLPSAPFLTWHIITSAALPVTLRPSTHSQLLGYISGFLTLLLLNAKYFMSVASNDSHRWYLS